MLVKMLKIMVDPLFFYIVKKASARNMCKKKLWFLNFYFLKLNHLVTPIKEIIISWYMSVCSVSYCNHKNQQQKY